MIDNILLEFAQKMQALTESKLTQVMNDPLGHKLAQYMHTHLGIQDDAEVKQVPADYLKTKATWSGNEHVVVKGKHGWVLREPNSFVPTVITPEEPTVSSKVGKREDGVNWEDAIDPVAVYTVSRSLPPKVLSRASRQPEKSVFLQIADRLRSPVVVSSVITSTRIQLKRESKSGQWKGNLKDWTRWLFDLQSALNEGENEVMSDIDWFGDDGEDLDAVEEAEDFWNNLVRDSLIDEKWKAALAADKEIFSKRYPTNYAGMKRGFIQNDYMIGPNVRQLMTNTLWLQGVKQEMIDNLMYFIDHHSLA